VTRRPRGLLFDYGGTLLEEVAFDRRAGIEALLKHAVTQPPPDHRDEIFRRADRVSREVADRRDDFGIETPWVSLTRLIHDFFGTRFAAPLAELELAFWDAAVMTRPMPDVADALREFRRSAIPMGVISNSSFGHGTIRHELAKHGLADFISVFIASAEYAVRKPNPLLFDIGAARLGLPSADIWFVGDRLDTDVAGARAAGMTAVWFGGTGDLSRSTADLNAPAWADLVSLFRDAEIEPTIPHR
jgi:putative hydrolase of the HAD superfamily